MSLATLFREIETDFCPTCKNLTEKEDSFVLEVVVAGVKAKDVDLSLEKGVARIEAESGCYRYSYLIPIPMGQIDETAAPEAVVEDGILKITFPKAKAPRPLKISVKG